MKKISACMIIIVLIVSLFCVQSPCFAQNMLRKLGRGVANVTTSTLEVPKAIQESFYDDGPMAAATYGLLDGIYKFIARTVVGLFEIVTFRTAPPEYEAIFIPFHMPECITLLVIVALLVS